jgi:hypothetical protein
VQNAAAAAAATIAHLRAQLAAERRALEFQKALTVGAISEADAMRNELSAISARHERALIRGAKLREALEPFARYLNLEIDDAADEDVVECFQDVAITVGDIRRARAVLEETRDA